MSHVQQDAVASVGIAEVYGRPLQNMLSLLKRNQFFKEFRCFKHSEPVVFLTLDGTIKEHNVNATYKVGGPRLIIGTRPSRRFVYTPTGEEGIPQVGQPYMTENNQLAFGVAGMTESFPLYAYTSEEVAAE